MKTIELSTGTLVVANTPDGFTNGMVVDDPAGAWLIGYSYVGKLPSSGFQLLGHPSEITGEVWGKVVETIVEQPEFVGDWSRTFHKNYVTKVYKYWDALPSGLSLIAAHNIKDTDVLLFKPKEV